MNLNRAEDEIPQLRREILQNGKLLTEEVAGYLIACQLGSDFTSLHTGHLDDSADCQISFKGKPHALLEVTRDSSPDREALFDKILKSESGEKMPLPPGQGAWACELTLSSRIDELTPERICGLLASLREIGIDHLHADLTWPRGPEVDFLLSLGLRSIRRLDVEGDFIFRHIPIVGGAIDDSTDLLADFAESIINNPEINDKINRLSRRAGALDRHFCIVIGSASDLSVQWRMNGISLVPPLPERKIGVPLAINFLWVMSMESGRLLGYSQESGWSDFQYPATASPWWNNLDLVRIQDLKVMTDRYHQLLTRNRNRPNA